MSGRTHRDIKSQELKIMEGTMFGGGRVWGNKDEMKGSFTKKPRERLLNVGKEMV
jgi:hypothetical protein